MTDFTEQEKGQMGRIFPGNLFSNVVTVIRDAILAAPKFTERVREVVAGDLSQIRLQIDEVAVYQATAQRLLSDSDFLAKVARQAGKDLPSRAEFEEMDGRLEAVRKLIPAGEFEEPAEAAEEKKPTEAKPAAKKTEKGSAKKKLSALSEFAKEDS